MEPTGTQGSSSPQTSPNSGGGGGGGSLWGAIVNGIFQTVGYQQQLQNQTAGFQQAQFFRSGSYQNNQQTQDFIILGLLVLVLIALLYFTK